MLGIRSIALNKVTQIVAAVDSALKSMIMSIRGDGLKQPLSNALVFDGSSSAMPVTVNGNIQQSAISPLNNPGMSYVFDGGSYLTAPASTATQLGTGDFTAEAWINPSVLNSSYGRVIFGTYTYNGTLNGWALSIEATTGKLVFMSYGISQSANVTLTSTTSLTLNAWQHVAVTRSGTLLTLWINGTSSGTMTSSFNENGAQLLKIGTQEANSISPTLGHPQTSFIGKMSNIRLVKGTAVYTSAFTTPISALTNISGTTLLTLQGPTIVDASSTAATFTTGGTVTSSLFSPPIISVETELTATPTTSTYFSGTSDYLTTTLASPIGTGDFTIEGWVKPSTTENRGVFQLSTTAGGLVASASNGLSLLIDNAGIAPWGLYWGNSYMATPVTAATAAWTHFAIVRTGGFCKLYLNGTLAVTNADSVNYTGTYLAIGGYTSAGYLFKGYISNFRIVQGAAVYTADFTPQTSPLSAISGTTFLGLQCNTQIDTSVNARSIASNGACRVTAFTPFAATYGSAYLDGSGDFLTLGPSENLSLGTGDYTIETWVKFMASGFVCDIIGNYISSSAADWMILRTGGNQLQYYPSAGTSWITGPVVPDNVWCHIAAVRRSGVVQLYVDGVAYGNGSYVVSSNVGDSTRPVYVGARAATGSYVNGLLAHTRIVKGTAVYTSNFTSPSTPSPSVAGTSVLLNYGNYAVYDSAASNTITVTGTPTIDTDVVKGGTGSLRFIVNGYLSAQNPNLAWGTGDFTIEFWMNSQDVSGSQLGMFQTSTTTGGLATSYATGIHLLQGVSTAANGVQGAYYGAISGTIGQTTYGSSTQVIEANAWYHVAVVRRSGVLTTYVNGVSVDSRACTDNVTGNNICVGGYYSGGYLFNGRLDLFRVYDFAKYTASFTPSST